LDTVKSGGQRNALFVEREGKRIIWNWDAYFRETVNFAKALLKLKVKERSTVAIMGFNSPEFVFSFIGSLLYNCVCTGIY